MRIIFKKGKCLKNWNKKAQAVDGFTLAELLIALAILGIIATFTVPKVLNSSDETRYNTVAKEAIGAAVSALKILELEGGKSSTSTFADLTQYINYVYVDTSTVLNNRASGVLPSVTCEATAPCLKLASGAMIKYTSALCFGGETDLHSITFQVDPSGELDTIEGLRVFMYYNGLLRTDATLENNTQYASTCAGTSSSNADPPDPGWFSW